MALRADRVAALQPGFAIDDRNVADAVDLCRRLDGLPLAIELAAARVPLLWVRGVRERLNERLRMLTDGARRARRLKTITGLSPAPARVRASRAVPGGRRRR